MDGHSVALAKNKEVKIEKKDPSSEYPDGGKVKENFSSSLSTVRIHQPDLPGRIHSDAYKEGEKDALKDIVRDKEINENMLDEALDRAQTIIFRCKTVFPFDFFPNDLIIDLSKVTVVKRNFFMSGGMQSVYMRDIVDVEVETGPLFSTLSVVDMFYAQNKLEVKYLKKEDALRAREIILGVVAANKLNVNVTKIDGEDLLQRIRSLARANRAPAP